ncbi:MAG: helix-turn-helix domain-containing protein [Myxococcota bacterium]
MRRRVVPGGDGLVSIEQRFFGDNPHAVIATASSWFVSLVRVERGLLEFRDGHEVRRAPRQFVLFVPPKSMVRMPVFGARIHTQGWGGLGHVARWPARPLAVPIEEPTPDLSVLRATVEDADESRVVDADRGCSTRIRESRLALIDAMLQPLPVGRVARRSGWNSSVFSRSFRAAYGISPRAYCQRLRVHDAMMMLLTGVSIARVAFDAGFGDVSQFYRQFRRVTGAAPGRYRS